MKEFIKRLFWFVILLVMSSVFPWWFVGIFFVVLSFLFDNYFEIVIVGIVYDIIFFTPGLPWYLSFVHTVMAIGIYLIMMIVHKNTRKPNILL